MATIETPKAMPLRKGSPWLSETAQRQIWEYAPTFLTEFAVMASQIVVYKLASYYMGKQGFSEYAIARRAISTVYPIALLGFGVGLPRYIAISAGQDRIGRGDRFFGAALLCVGTASAILIALINLMPSIFSYLIYGTAAYRVLAFPVSLTIVGLTLHAVAYSYFRGHMLMAKANVLQFANLAAVPLLSFLGAPHDVGVVLKRIGLLSIFVSLISLVSAPWQQVVTNTLAEAKILLRYSVPRVPGDFAQMALLGLPAFVVAHQVGVQDAGYVAFGISVLSMISAAFAPVGLVLLPKSSQMFASGAITELWNHVRSLLKASLLVSVGLTALAFFTIGPLVQGYLGRDYSEVARIVRFVCIGAIPYSVFLVLRNVLDALHETAVTSLFLIVALFVAALGSTIGLVVHLNWTVTIFSFLAALTVLGTLAALAGHRAFRRLLTAETSGGRETPAD